MRRFITALTLTVISAAALHAGCPLHGCGHPSKRPHFFSARHFHEKVHSCIHGKMYRMGLIRIPASGDMHGHTPYETWEVYYYDRPYQAYQIDDVDAVSGGKFWSALADIYHQRETGLMDLAGELDPLEYAEQD